MSVDHEMVAEGALYGQDRLAAHPNIAQIYGLEKSDGIRALVMEPG